MHETENRQKIIFLSCSFSCVCEDDDDVVVIGVSFCKAACSFIFFSVLYFFLFIVTKSSNLFDTHEKSFGSFS